MTKKGINPNVIAILVAIFMFSYIAMPICLFGLLLEPVIGDWAILPSVIWIIIGPLSAICILEYLTKRSLVDKQNKADTDLHLTGEEEKT
jgi:uncharacterized membrane protein YuzA (DUF378 family)